MKKRGRTTRILFGFLFSFLLVQPEITFAQNKLVTLDYKDASFLEVISAFQKQTGVKFLYNIEKVKNKRCDDLRLHNVPVDQAIQIVLGAFGFTYSMVEGVVVVNEALNTTTPQDSPVRMITGKVVSKSGENLPGVTIRIKGTPVGMATDINGNFSIMLPGADTYTLVFSFVGMETKEVVYKEDKPLTVVLEYLTEELDEVVVRTGYQSINRRDMVGSYTAVKAEDIMMPAYNSIDQMLQGKIPGLVMMNTTSRVGRAPKITIRGTSTILGNSDPLWVVDGIIQSDPLPFDVSSAMTEDLSQMIGNQISWLNPADIETITVLKDASATAVYGSKASNGVIVITTKKGSAERQSIRYTGNFSFRTRPNYDMFNFMNSKERIHFSKEAYDAGVRYQNEPLPQIYTYEGLMRLFNERQIPEEYFIQRIAQLEMMNTDWFDLLTQNSFSQNHNLSLSGGTQRITYSASLGYSKSKGVEIGNEYDQLTARLNINAQLMKNLRLDFSLMGSRSNNKGFGPGVDPMNYATTTNRALPAFEDNGDYAYYKMYYNYALNSSQQVFSYNILNELDNSYANSKASRLDINMNLDWKITSWLTYQLVGGIADSGSESESFAGEKTNYIAQNYRGYDYGTALPDSDLFKAAMLPFGGELFTSNARAVTYNMQHKVLLSKTFHSDHRINAMLGVEIRSVDNKNESNTVWGYVPDRGEKIVKPTPISDLVPIGTVVPASNWGILDNLYNGKWSNQSRTDNYFSFFATFAYSLKNKYVFNANVRSDASNRFGQDISKRYDPTYSFGVSWRVAEENFIKDHVFWLDQMNFRATWGIQGNVVNNLSPDLIVSQSGIDNAFKQYMLTINSLPNPQLTWERTRTWNFGLDLQLFKALTMSLEYYGKTSNAIVSQDIAMEYGMPTMKMNGGHITNQGIEFSMNITPFQRKDFAWTVGVNASKNWNKSDSESAMIKSDAINKNNFISNSGNRLLKKGYPVTGFWSYDFAGLDSQTGYPTFNLIDVPEEQRSKTIDPTTFLTYSGQTDPYFTGGLNTRIRYKSISVGADFSVLLGGKKRLPNPYANFANLGKLPDPYYNISKDLNNRWKKPADEKHTIIPALFTSINEGQDYNAILPDMDIVSIYDMWANSDAMVVSTSFLRCTQLSLTYNMDPKLCSKFGAVTCSISANVNNPFVIANKRFNGFDPELDNSVQPKIFTFGLSVGF